MRNRSAQLVIAALVMSVMLAGCDAVQQAQNAAKRQQMANNLKQLGLAYHNFYDQNKRGPANWQEVQSLVPTEVQTEIQNAGYTVIWGVNFRDVLGGMSEFIVAYPADAATNGGLVLMLDAATRQVTAQEFNDTFAKQKIDSPNAMAGAADSGDATAPADASSPASPPAAPGY